MQQSTKQRIVGSVVLLALALIFLPILFDGQGSYETQLSNRIPEAPQFEPLQRPSPVRPEIAANQPGFSGGNGPDETETVENETDEEIQVPEADDEEQPGAETEIAVLESTPDFDRSEFTSEVPQLGDDGLPRAWSVRLGSFAEPANAEELLDRLQQAGYKAYSRQVNSQQGELTAVFVGPWVDRARTDEYLNELQDQFRLTGIVVRYSIDPL